MNPSQSLPDGAVVNRPWYRHRWPWLLMLGPAAVVAAGIHTTWLAFSRQDALVVDDYYTQGKAINLELRRDRVARDHGMAMTLGYDPAGGALRGNVTTLGQPHADKVTIRLVHSTQPEKDLVLEAQPDRQGQFSVPLPMLEIARWQVQVEGRTRDWRLRGVWSWPQERSLDLKPY